MHRAHAGVTFLHTQHKTTTILKSSIPSHRIDVSKKQFCNEIDFSQGIDAWGPSKFKHLGSVVITNDDLFDRLETVHFFRLFTGEGDKENTGRGNTEPRDLKTRVLP